MLRHVRYKSLYWQHKRCIKIINFKRAGFTAKLFKELLWHLTEVR
jgi:hypothetical protein